MQVSNFGGTFDQLFLWIFLWNFHRRCVSTFSIPWCKKVKNDQKLKSRGSCLNAVILKSTFRVEKLLSRFVCTMQHNVTMTSRQVRGSFGASIAVGDRNLNLFVIFIGKWNDEWWRRQYIALLEALKTAFVNRSHLGGKNYQKMRMILPLRIPSKTY